jgi:hypothetical protein
MTRKLRPSIPEPFHRVTASLVTAGEKTAKIPTLVLRGEWLKAAGFPIGSNAYVMTDARGEIALHRIGIRPPRKLRIVATRR